MLMLKGIRGNMDENWVIGEVVTFKMKMYASLEQDPEITMENFIQSKVTKGIAGV